MIEPIRLATPEEIEKIRETSDLSNATNIFAFEKNLAVLRRALEVDPVHFDSDAPAYKRALFLWGIEAGLRLNGVPEYYFNVLTTDEDFIKTVEGFGAVKVSTGPEYRFKRVLQ